MSVTEPVKTKLIIDEMKEEKVEESCAKIESTEENKASEEK